MLIQFNFKNHKSFRDETTLDMSATKITEHKERVVTVGKEKLLRLAAIYGANGGGKSNVIDAFSFMRRYVMESLTYGGRSSFVLDEYVKREKRFIPNPFIFNDTSKYSDSEFEVFIIDKNDGKSYQYGFSLNGLNVVEEWLYSKSKTGNEYKTVFYRNAKTKEFNFIDSDKNQIANLKAGLGDETLAVSFGAQIKIFVFIVIQEWFNNSFVLDMNNVSEDKMLVSRHFIKFLSIPELKEDALKFLHSFDETIIDFNIKQINNDDNDPRYEIYSEHRNNNSNATTLIHFIDESSGTKKMFYIFPLIWFVIRLGKNLFIDEMNAKLHPLLVRNLILIFANPEINTNNAQFIFTTHDTWQLSNDLLRRDEIWFVDKNENGVTTLYSLADFMDEDGVKIRKDEDYEKNYLLGKYGAIPSLKTMTILKDELKNG